MMQERAILTLGCWSLGVTLGLVAACAGGDTPARDQDLEDQIAQMYAGGAQVAAAGSGGGPSMSGSGGGSATPGTGGSSASGSGGSSMAGGAGSGSVVPSGGSGGGGSSSSGCDGFAILQSKCNGGSCHGSAQAGGLSNFALDEMTAKGFAGETSQNCASSDNAPIFDPDNPAASLVVKKITATSSCGGRMPLGATTQQLTDTELTCVKDWIGGL